MCDVSNMILVHIRVRIFLFLYIVSFFFLYWFSEIADTFIINCVHRFYSAFGHSNVLFAISIKMYIV